MKKKTIGILLIILVLFISIGAISAADANETLMEEVSDTEIATTSVAVEQDNAISQESESGGDVEINVTDSRDEISTNEVKVTSKSNEVLSASNDDVLKASSNCFYWVEGGRWYEDLRDAMDNIASSSSKTGTILVNAGTYTELDRVTCGDIYIHFESAATITIQPFNKGDTVIFDGSVAKNNYLFWLDHQDLKVTFNDITFKKGHATADGGAIEVAHGQVTLNNCLLTENEALDHGGAVSVADAGTFIANNCRFINNWAEDDGGAISCEDDGTVELHNCYFEGNKKIKDSIEEENDFGYEDGASKPGFWTFDECQFKGHGSIGIEVDRPTKSVEITPEIDDQYVNLVVLYKDGSYYDEKPWAEYHSVEFTDLEKGTYTVYMMQNHEKRYEYPNTSFTIVESYFVLDDKDVFETLSEAVNAIPNGGSGVITVESRTYTESANFNVQIRNKVVTIRPKIISEYEDTVIFSADSQNYLLNVGPNAQLILEDIVITGKFSEAALIFTSDLESSITDCEFNNIKNSENQPGTPINAENSKLELNGTNFELNGNIILKNTVATINECTFTNNTGEQGGAIYANPSSDLTITSSEFTHNIANEGGAIYATNLKVEGSEFTLNVAELGGAVYITDKGDSLVNITSSVFDSNVATNFRNIYSASPTRKFNLEFNEYDLDLSMNEKDASYGADYILTGVFDWGSNLNNTVTLLSGTIDENIFGEVLTIEDNKFNINLGVLSGGTHELSMIGMFTQGDSADHFYTHMYYSDLNGNEFYLTNPAYLKVVISKAKILLNLEVKDVLIPEIPVLNVHANWDNNYTIFIGNKYYQLEVVKGKGSMQLTGLDLGNYSVVAMRDADEDFDFVMNFTTFSISKTYSNFIVLSTNVEYDTLAEAVANSDAEDTIYVKKGTYTDTKIVISNKTLDIVALENAVFDAQGSDANFIIINQNAEVYIHGITFRGIHNRNTNYGAIVNHGYLSVDSCNFTDNKITKTSFAGNGGAAIFSDGESLEIDNCNFINNVAPLKASTAAVTSLGYEDISITDSKFINNTARDGGAVHFKNISQFEPAIISCEFEQNTAVKGSAIYVGNNSRYVSVSLSNFVKNNVKNSLGEKAQLEGGAIYVNANNDDVALDISLSNFEHNSNSDVDGGAICLDGSSNAFIDSCVFNNNSGKLGSAILIKNPNDKKLTLLLDSSTFINNHATNGAVATSPRVTALFDECIFANNTGENRNIYSNGFTVAHDTVFDVKDAKLSALSVSYGNDSIIKGTVDIGANIYSAANLTVDGENVIVEVENNKFTYNAGVLNQGKHTAVLNNVVDMNNNTYLMDSITVNFKVNRASVEFNVSVDNITYGETLKVVETLPSTVSGTVSYQLNGKYYTKDELESLKLDAGNYTLVASYNNENYVPSTSIINFVVNKANPTISVEDVEVEDNGTVVVNIKTNVPSIYTIEIGDYKTDKYVNGSRSVEIDKIFEPGTYTIKVTSQERVNYISNFTEATLKVTKTLGAFTLSASNKVTSPNNAIIGVSAPENAVGNITYTITDSNKNVVKTLTQSCRDDLIVSGLDAGDYEINAVFEGDDLYYSTSNIKMAPLSIMRSANNEDIRTSGEDDYNDDEYYNYPFIYQEDEDSDYEYYETLEEAIDAASLMGGIITVRGGTYYLEDGIDIEGELEITIRAFEGEEVIFDCQHQCDFLYLTYDTEVEVIEAVPPIPVIYNTPGPTITLENLTVINGYAVSDGAVIEMDAGILTLMNCNFYNNDAEYGGVIYIGSASSDQDADVIAVNCTFINNTARSEGGAIYISEGLEQFVSASFAGCTFLDNYQGEGDERTMNYFAGDAVEEIVKKACVFNGKGTLDFNVDKINQTVTVVGTSEDAFDSVVLMYFGHVPLYSIYNNGSQSFNVTFEDVMGGNYTIGVMNDHDLNTYIFTDKQFEMKVPNFIISADEVYENLTDAIGNVTDNGIIYANANYHIDENMEIVFNKSFTLKNFRDRMVVFDGNSTNWFFTVPEGYNVVIENIEFVDGGIKDYASIENYGSLTLKNCTFTAFETESIIYNSGSLNITGGVFSLNSINNAIVLNDGNLFIDGAEFSSNVINTNSVVYNNGNAEIVASNFTENINNGNGGAIYNKNSLTIKDTVFNENEGINGGAVYNEGTLEVLNSTFEDNTAKGYGGAIFNDGEANIDNSSFSGGFSEKDGGALYNNNVMIVNNSNLVANTATGNGGAIYNNKTLKLTESFFGINFAYEFANIYNAGDVEEFKNNTFDFYDVILYVPDGEYGIPTTITGTLDPQFNMDMQLILPEFVNYEDALVTVTDGIFEYNTGILPKGAYDVILNEILYDTNGNVYYGEAIRDRLIINKAKVYINLTVDDIILKNADTATPVLKISASKNGTYRLLFNNRLTTFTIAGTEAEITLDSVGEGNYSVMVIREGDENFNDAVNTTTFTVSEYIGNFIVNSTGGKFDTLRDAISNSAAEDIIYVMEGNYTGADNIGLNISNKKLSIISLGEVIFDAYSGDLSFLTVDEKSDVTLSGITITGFNATEKKIIFNQGNLTVDGCYFVNNTLIGFDTGIIYNDDGNLNIVESEFYDNNVSLSIIDSRSGIIMINESTFEDNIANSGRIISVINANSVKVISNSFAQNKGQILRVISSSDVLISSLFNNNTNGINLIFASRNSNLVVNNSIFEGNEFSNIIYLYENAKTTISESVFTGNDVNNIVYSNTDNLSVLETTFSANTISSNSVLYVPSNINTIVDGCVFTDNKALINRNIDGSATLKITNSVFDAINVDYSVNDIDYKQNETIEGTIDIGINIPFTVNLDINGKTYSVNVTNNKFTYTLSDLTGGEYEVVLNPEDNNSNTFVFDKITKTFAVNRIDPGLKVTISNITQGEKLEVNAELINNATDKILYQLNGKWYDEAQLENLTLNHGNYFVTAAYGGNKNYYPVGIPIYVEVYKITPNITVSDAEANYGEDIEINVKVDVADYYTVFIDDRYEESVSLYIDGSGTFIVPSENFKPGKYEIKVYKIETDNYNEAYGYANLTVKNATGFFRISNNTIKYGENVTVRVTSPVNAYGNITYKVYQNADVVYTVTQSCVEDLVLPNLSVGTYIITGTFEGDSYYTNESKVISGGLRIIIKDVNLNVTVSNITYGENAVVTVDADTDGKYLVYVGNETYEVTVINGTGNVSVPDLTVGIYKVNASAADDNYSAFNETVFEVIPKSVSVEVSVENIVEGENAVVTVKADVDGKYLVNVGNETYEVTVTDGTGNISVPDLTAGKYDVNVTADNGNYTGSNSTAFTVKHTIILVPDVVVDENNVTITVNVDKDATGFVKFTTGGNDLFVEVKDGKAFINTVLPVGNYTVVATYVGDDNFAANSTDINFTVEEKPLIDTPIAIDTQIDENNITMIVSVDENATGLVKFEVTGAEEYTVYAEVENGKAILEDVLTVGDYTVVATYLGDDNYSSNSTEESFTIVGHVKKDTAITAVPTVDGTSVTIVSTVDENATGYVTIAILGQTFIVPVDNGKAEFKYDFAPGTYSSDVTYLGDDDFNNASTTASFTVTEQHVELKNTTIDVIVGSLENDVTIIATVDSSATGLIEFNIGGESVYLAVNNGEASYNLILPAGNYTVDVTYLGDDKFNSNRTSKAFTVTDHIKQNTTIASDVVVEENNVTIIVTVDEDATGFVKFTTSASDIFAEVKDGKAVVNTVFPAGNYTIVATYLGDNDFNENSTEINFSVVEKPLNDTPIDVIVGSLENDVTIIATVDSSATGLIEFNIGGESVYLAVNNGVSIYNLVLPAGDYNVEVTYLGDEKFNSNRTSKAFTVTDHIKQNTTISSDVIVEENNVTIIVTVDENATGFVKFTTSGSDLFVEVKDGKAVISTVLPAGNYTVIAEYLGDDDFNANSTEINFSVVEKPLNDTPIDIDIQIDENNVTITVSVDENATGLVKFEVSGAEEYTLYAEVEDGKAILEDVLTVGDYTVVATYMGDENFNMNSTTETFNIVGHVKKDTTITAVPTVDGYTVTIESTVDENATGYVTIAILGQTFVVPVNDGKAVFTYDFTPGTYSSVVTYLGDDDFNNASTTASFTVTKQDVELKNTTIDVNVNSIDNDVTITAFVDSSASGLIEFNIGGESVYLAVNNGVSSYDLVLPAGDYNVDVTYLGDDKFNSNRTSKAFTVTDHIKQNTTIASDVAVDDNNVMITVTVNEEATGFVKLTTSGTDIFAEVKDGKAVVNTVLPAGNYTIVATYLGDDEFNANETVISFTVADPESTVVNITIPDDLKPGDNATVKVEIPNATGNVTVIVDGKETVVKLVNGSAEVPITGVTEGDHNVVVIYSGDDKHAPAYDISNFTVRNYIATKFVNITITENLNIEALLLDANGNPIANAVISYAVGNYTGTTTTNANGLFKVAGILGEVIEFSYAGNDKYLPINTSIKFERTIPPLIPTQFNVTDGFRLQVYAVDYKAGERGAFFDVLLTDVNGKALVNQTVFFAINGWVHIRTTDANGVAHLQINLQDSNYYTCAPCFLGDETYNATFASAMLDVIKKPTSISAAAKSYKATAKTKKYTVTLKTIKGSSADGKTYLKAGKKVTLKVNGKTYTAKTNAKGQATFSLKLTKKGKFQAVIKYAGSNTYEAATKKVTITIK